MAGSEVSGTAANPFRPATENSSSRRGRLRSNVGWPFLARAVGKRLALTGFLSAAVIVVWSFVGRELPVFVALPAMGALSLLATLVGAGAGFAVAAVAGRDQAESVLMLSKATSRAKGVSLYDPLTAMFQRWYLERRIEEELRRSRRYGESVSVIALRIETTEAEAGIMTEQSLNLQIARLAAHSLRAVDISASSSESEYAFCLPNTDLEGAMKTVSRLHAAVGPLPHAVGVANFPDGAADGRDLLQRALLQLDSAAASASEAADAPALRDSQGPPSTERTRPAIKLSPASLKPGEMVLVEATVPPFAECAVSLRTPAGRLSRNAALVPRQADAAGQVAWSWTLGAGVKPGTAMISVAVDGLEAVVPLIIEPASLGQVEEPRLRLIAV